MSELKNGEKVRLIQGGEVTVKRELGRGGQGIVYLVDYEGKEFALKWYLKDEGDLFYRNLQHNAQTPAPSGAFLWPLHVTERMKDSFGYVMQLRPKEYAELGDFFTAKARFTSFDAILNAALSICNGFNRLHTSGYCYQDLNEGNFFINPQTGDLLICDNDNVAANHQNSGIKGKSRYMAPEVVNGGMPNIDSDVFSLAIVLYRLFMLDHPFEGQNTLRYVCLTEEEEHKLYGSQAVFAWDDTDDSNRPHREFHRNAVIRWQLCPPSLKSAFQKALGKDAVRNPKNRMSDRQWKELFLQLRRDLIVCDTVPGGKEHDFLSDGAIEYDCPMCGSHHKVGAVLHFQDGRDYLLTRHKKLYLEEAPAPSGLVRIRKTPERTDIALENTTSSTWMVNTPSGKIREVKTGDIMPLRTGMSIRFSSRDLAKVEIP